MSSVVKGDYYSRSSRYAPPRSFRACIPQPASLVAQTSTRLTAGTSARTYPITAPDTTLFPIPYLAADSSSNTMVITKFVNPQTGPGNVRERLIENFLCLQNVTYAQYLTLSEHLDRLAAARVGIARDVRIYYDGYTGMVTLAGPSIAHETVASFSSKIHETISTSPDFYGQWQGDDTKRIINTQNCQVLLPHITKPGGRQPDGSLSLAGDKIPFLVVEVADTQSEKDLLKLARQYIIGSDGAVHIVILIKLERKKIQDKKKGKNKRPYTEENYPEGDQDVSDTLHPGAPGGAAAGSSVMGTSVGDHGSELMPGDPQPSGATSAAAPKEPVYTHGYFWAFGYTLTPDPARPSVEHLKIDCMAEAEEFFPGNTNAVLTLTWESIMDRELIPAHVADKSVSIRYSYLQEFLALAQLKEQPGFTSKRTTTRTSVYDDLDLLDESSMEVATDEEEHPENEAQDPNFLSEVGAVDFDRRVTRSGARTDGQAQ